MAPAAPVSIYIYLCLYLYLYLCLFIYTHMHVHVRDSHASLESQEVDPMRFPRNSHVSLESQEVDPMRFPARGTSDEDHPMGLRTRTPTSSRKEGIFVSTQSSFRHSEKAENTRIP